MTRGDARIRPAHHPRGMIEERSAHTPKNTLRRAEVKPADPALKRFNQ